VAGIDYRFDDPQLLREALTHRSLGAGNNERLEFLGDSVLNLVIAMRLYELQPKAREGDLSRVDPENVVEYHTAFAQLRAHDSGHDQHPGTDPVIEPAGQDSDRTHNKKSQGGGPRYGRPRPAEFCLKLLEKNAVSKHRPNA